MEENDSATKGASTGGKYQIGYDDRVGRPEGVPYDFIHLIIAFPDRCYGTWWYQNRDGIRTETQGWYIWIESQHLIGLSCGRRLVWRNVANFEDGLIILANLLR